MKNLPYPWKSLDNNLPINLKEKIKNKDNPEQGKHGGPKTVFGVAKIEKIWKKSHHYHHT